MFIHVRNTYLSMIGILTYPCWEYLLILAWRGSICRVFNNINMEFWFLPSNFVGRNFVLVLFKCLKTSNRLLVRPKPKSGGGTNGLSMLGIRIYPLLGILAYPC